MKLMLFQFQKGLEEKLTLILFILPNGKSITVDKKSIFHQFVQEIRDETHRYTIDNSEEKNKKDFYKVFS